MKTRREPEHLKENLLLKTAWKPEGTHLISYVWFLSCTGRERGKKTNPYLLPILRLDPHVLRTDLPRPRGLNGSCTLPPWISARVVSLNFVRKKTSLSTFLSPSSSPPPPPLTDGDGDPWLARWCPFVPAHRGAEQGGKQPSPLRAEGSLHRPLFPSEVG